MNQPWYTSFNNYYRRGERKNYNVEDLKKLDLQTRKAIGKLIGKSSNSIKIGIDRDDIENDDTNYLQGVYWIYDNNDVIARFKVTGIPKQCSLMFYNNMSVMYDYTGKGVAKEIINFLKKLGPLGGYTKLMCTAVVNHKTKEFYKKTGFKTLGRDYINNRTNNKITIQMQTLKKLE